MSLVLDELKLLETATEDEGKRFRERAEQVVKYPAATQTADRLRSEYEKIESNMYPLTRGVVGFLLFMDAAERLDKQAADSYLNDRCVARWVFETYGMPPEYTARALSFYKKGTTSFICQLTGRSEPLVAKLIKPSYWDNQLIREETYKYKDRVAVCEGESTPRVEESADRWVVMEFVKGPTLREYIAEELWAEPGLAIMRSRGVMSELCRILGKLGRSHGDLSPDNVIVARESRDGEELPELKLIDFGINYALSVDAVGTTEALLRAERYVAREVRQARAIAQESVLADVYSLGAIFVDLLFAEIRRRRNPFGDWLPLPLFAASDLSLRDTGNVIDRIRLTYQGLGDLLDELLDDSAKTRALEMRRVLEGQEGNPAPRLSGVFDAIKERVKVELGIYEHVYRESKRGLLSGVVDSLIGSYDNLIERIREVRFLYRKEGTPDARKEEYRESAKVLLAWLAVAEGLHLLTIYEFVKLAWQDVVSGAWTTELPGRLVALASSFVAVRYYSNIFSSVKPGEVDRRAEVLFRLQAFATWAPIFWALVVDPRSWPFCVAAGAVVAVPNNWIAYRLCRQAEGSRGLGRPMSELAMFAFYEWRGWWEQLTLFAFVAMLGFGVGRLYGLVHDQWPYAAITVAINFRNYYYPCSKGAPLVRCGLQTAVAALRRERLAREG